MKTFKSQTLAEDHIKKNHKVLKETLKSNQKLSLEILEKNLGFAWKIVDTTTNIIEGYLEDEKTQEPS